MKWLRRSQMKRQISDRTRGAGQVLKLVPRSYTVNAPTTHSSVPLVRGRNGLTTLPVGFREAAWSLVGSGVGTCWS
jgi:hypothetical protein